MLLVLSGGGLALGVPAAGAGRARDAPGGPPGRPARAREHVLLVRRRARPRDRHRGRGREERHGRLTGLGAQRLPRSDLRRDRGRRARRRGDAPALAPRAGRGAGARGGGARGGSLTLAEQVLHREVVRPPWRPDLAPGALARVLVGAEAEQPRAVAEAPPLELVVA